MVSLTLLLNALSCIDLPLYTFYEKNEEAFAGTAFVRALREYQCGAHTRVCAHHSRVGGLKRYGQDL